MDHVYLTQNSDPMPEHVTAQLRDFVAAGYVTLRAVPRPEFQAHFYFDCMQHHRHKHNWLAFIDVDEFIVLRKCAPQSLPHVRCVQRQRCCASARLVRVQPAACELSVLRAATCAAAALRAAHVRVGAVCGNSPLPSQRLHSLR